MLRVEVERFLWFWEKRRFKNLMRFIESVQHKYKYVGQIKTEILKILDGKYKVGEGGHHIWIHRKGSDNRLAVIWED